jgi:hypothetical protein
VRGRITNVTATTQPAPEIHVDAICAAAVETARAAAEEVAGDEQLGAYLGCDADDERVVTHYFASGNPGYIGWRWAVTVARAPHSRKVTINEVALLPGPDALLAPPWVPWSDRVRADDLGPGDLLPTAPDDPRLVPGYADTTDGDRAGGAGDEAMAPVLRSLSEELGLGRARVLSQEGRDAAAERWYNGPHGPNDPVARAAPAQCATCGFLVRLAGPLGNVFGVCANEFSPSDGKVVSFDHGCGAHSEAVPRPAPHPTAEPPEHVIDTLGYEDDLIFDSTDSASEPSANESSSSDSSTSDSSNTGQPEPNA